MTCRVPPIALRLRRRALLAGPALPLSFAAMSATIVRARTGAVPADDAGRLSWTAWEQDGRGGRAVHLGLGSDPAPRFPPVVAAWPDAFAPRLRRPAGWTRAGQPVVALTMHFGAAAEAVALFSVDPAWRPVRLGEKLADRVEWRADAAGRAVLVLLSRRDTAEARPSCFAWDAGALRAAACP